MDLFNGIIIFMEYKKITETEMEVVETITRKAVLSLDGLLAEKDGLLRTIEANNAECAKRNEQITQMIARLDEIIAEGQAKGLKMKAEVAPVVEETPVAEPISEPVAEVA